MGSFTRGGLLGEGRSLGGQQRTGVRTKAGAIPLSQAGTSACLEGEACLTWPACWVAGVNDSAVCSGLHGRLGRGPEKRCVGIQRDQVREETRFVAEVLSPGNRTRSKRPRLPGQPAIV